MKIGEASNLNSFYTRRHGFIQHMLPVIIVHYYKPNFSNHVPKKGRKNGNDNVSDWNHSQ
jgi:hypothetical protein